MVEAAACGGDVAVVRRRWNDPQSARVRAAHLRELRILGDPGGVCAPIARPFLYARVWCDHLLDGEGLHVCDAATAPHELELCVLAQDNDADLYARVSSRLHR